MFVAAPHLRWLGTCCLLLTARTVVLAQDIHHYRARVSGMATTMQEKQLTIALAERDELGEFRVDRATGEVDIKTAVALDRFRFEFLITPFQLDVVSYEEIGQQTTPDVRQPRRQQLADMPVYVDTGDPVRDNQRYDAFKAAWIAAHPEQYRELTAPVPLETQTK